MPRTLEDRLEIGEIGAVINITEGAALITPETSTVARQLSSEQLVQVPTSTRSFTQLLSAEAGVSSDLSPVLTNGNGNQSPSVNGTRTTSTSLFFNGVDATNITSNEGSLNGNIAPAPETLSEVKLQTSLYDASTGRSGGGNFQLVTKSGTNQFNGSAYYYLQNEKFNANDFFFNKDGIERPKAAAMKVDLLLVAQSSRTGSSSSAAFSTRSAETGFVTTASSITVLPAALAAHQRRANEGKPFRGFQPVEPRNPGFDSEGAMQFANWIAAASRTLRQLVNLQNPATGDFFIPAPRAGGHYRNRYKCRGKCRRQSIHSPAQRFPSGVQTGSVHGQTRWPLEQQEHLQRHVLLGQLPGFRSVSGSRQSRFACDSQTVRSQPHSCDIGPACVWSTLYQRSSLWLLFAEQHSRAGRPLPGDHQ